MADAVEGAGFWLPAEFFDDFVTGKDSFARNKETESGDGLRFPTEFPYELETPADAHFRRWVMSASPQSTLTDSGIWSSTRSVGGSSNGSPNGVYSPPTTPLGDPVGDLIHLAVGQVAKLKLNGGNDGVIVAPRNFNRFNVSAPKNPNPNPFQNVHFQPQQKQGWYGEPQMHQLKSTGRAMEGLHVRHNPIRSAGSGAAVKRGRAGTGVFLPRRYGNGNDNSAFSSSDSRQKTGSAFVPERNSNVVNKNLNNMNGFVQCQPKSINRGFLSNYDLARRNALMMLQHRRSLMAEQSNPPVACGICLPHEWTY